MSEKTDQNIIDIIKKHYKIFTGLLTIFLLLIFYIFMRSRTSDPTAYSHLMYLAIVFAGSILGSHFGMLTGLIAGILVGPLLPLNIELNTPQSFGDWFFRLIMMMVIGSMSGYFSQNYRRLQKQLKTVEELQPETHLFNAVYLNRYKFEDKQSYLLMSMIIINHETISEVSGLDTYYAYLHRLSEVLKTYDEDSVLIQADQKKFWYIMKTNHMDKKVQEVSKLIKGIHQIDDQKIFVDFGLGFHLIKYDKQLSMSSYFPYADQAAQEAIENHVLYVKYINLSSNKQYEYELMTEFETALYSEQVFLVYQPKIDLVTQKPKGLEALIRWYHPIKKTIYPDQFIPAVEKTSLIHQMTEVVFKKALVYLTKLKEAGISVPISINVSAKNIQDVRFYDKMIDIFNEFDILPEMIELEITESVIMDRPHISKEMLSKFSQFGFRIAIDDFGKGYSSLAYLAQFPINTIKIDRMFTKQILVSPVVQTIVASTVQMALQLGYEVLIEGVEDLETANLLKTYGCHTAQGYYYFKPQREALVTEYLVKAHTK